MARQFDFQTFFEDAEKSPAYWVERAVLEFTEDLVARMESEGISRAELARRIRCSPAYVTKILRGSTNFTLESMVRVAQAVGCNLRTHLQPDGARTHWFDLLDATPSQAGLFKNCDAMNRELQQYSVTSHRAEKENNDDPLPLAS